MGRNLSMKCFNDDKIFKTMKLTQLSRIFLLTLGLVLIVMITNGATFYSIADGNWNSRNTWSPTSGGTRGNSSPVAGDIVIIERGINVTVTANAACASVTFSSTTASTLTFSGAYTLTVSGTFTAGIGTVVYSGNMTQTIGNFIYNNLTLSNSSVKTITTATVNGILSMEGTATASAAPTYGPFATLQYNTTTARTAGPEWITPFVATGGVLIAGTGAITLNAAKVFGASAPLTINLGSTLLTTNLQLTFGGNFTNAGTLTAGSSPIVISDIALTQSIAGFSTTGLVSMTKTAGTATFIGNVSGGGLTINGPGGILDLGTGLTHTFSGIWTRTAGTLNGNTSTLKLGSSVSGSGATFNPGNGTVEWYAAGAQNCYGYTYNNLTLSGSGIKTTDGVTVNGTLSMEGTATASAAPTYGPAASLQYNNTTRTAGIEWITPFTTSGGVIIRNTGIITLNSANVLNGTLTTIAGATMTLTSSLTVSGTITNGGILNGGTGTLTVGSNFSGGTFNANTGTVIYNGAAQTVGSYTFNNLTLSGSGIKTTAGVTVNKVLSMEGTATASAAPAYTAGATLQYNTTTPRNTGPEWLATFPTAVAINITTNTAITLNSASVLNGILTINSSASLTLASTLQAPFDIVNIGSLNGGTGTLRIGGSVSGGGTFTANSGTVEYYLVGAQNVGNWIYNNLTLSGSGIKTITTASTTVTGILSMDGTATASAAPTYGPAATLQYATTHTSGNEWLSPFVASGGVIINSGVITLNAAKVFNASVPLTINTGATLNTSASNYQLTFGGNFTNSGTFTVGSSPIVISDIALTQSIAGFSTTGLVSMTKTAGTATFIGNVSGGGLTINGPGGILDLGTGLTHTFSGIWTRTAGTLNGNTSTLKLGSSVSGSGATFNPGNGTVEWYAAGAQNCYGYTYNNLTLSGSGIKTTDGVTVNGTLSMEGTATASAAPIYGPAATLQYNNITIARTAGVEWITPFTTSGGVIIKSTGAITLNSDKVLNGTLTTIAGATMTLASSLTVSGTITNGGILNGGTGTLTVGSNFSGGTFNANTGTVIYNGAAQTVGSYTFNNLTLSGSGIKTTAGVTVNKILSMEGTATASAAPAYTAGATLQYNTTTPRNTGPEWLATFPNAVAINITSNTAITLNSASVLNGLLTINSSASLTLASTLTAPVNIVNIGSLNGGSGKLKIGGSVSGGGTFTANSGTVEYYLGAQTVGNWIYNNLTLSGSGIKTITTASTTVTGILSMDGTATASAAPTYGPAATLQYATTHTSGNEWLSPFVATGGVIINSGVITLNSDKVLNASIPLTINTGATLAISTFTMTVNSNINNNGSLTSGTGTLRIGGSFSGGTFTRGTGTVEYFGGAQTVGNYTYNNLTLKGTSVKTTTGVTVNGILSMEESATVTAAPAYGAAATLQYNTATARTTGPEWITPFTTTGGVIIANIGLITLNSANVLNGALTINSSSGFAFSSTLTVSGNVINNGSLNVGTTLRIGGNASGNGTLTATGTVEYYNGAQTVGNFIYNNLTLSGSNNRKTMSTPVTVTVNGILSIEGGAYVDYAPKYGPNATLQYNTNLNYDTGPEWLTTFVATGGVIIKNTGIIYQSENKVFGTSSPFTISSGSTFDTQDYNLTFGGNFINNNTAPLDAGYSNITITGTMTTQSIDGFSTNGDVSMTKTAGTATFTHNVSASGLIINGAGGTLNLGNKLTHLFSGTWTRTNGTLDGGSSLLRLGSSVGGSGGGTFTANSGTVEYYKSGTQTGANVVYNNLTLSGSNTKTITGYTVNGVLSMEGTATVSSAPTYGSAATLQYNTATSRTEGVEWISPFNATGGVIIANTGTITLNSVDVLGTMVPLTINSNSRLSTGNNSLTFGGNFINNGTFTAGSSPIVIAGTMDNQSIAGFTTTGLVSMTKTGGTATLTGNVNGNGLTIDGIGGTLNLGNGFTHQFTGTWTRNNGTLIGGSSLLRLGSSFAGTGGGTFTPGAGTFEYYAASAQNVAAVTYFNLILSGGSLKTIIAGTVINGNLLIKNTGTKAILTNGININAGGLTLEITNKTYGTWGSTAAGSAATYHDDNFFSNSASGIVTVLKPGTLVVTVNTGGGGDVCTGANTTLTSSGTNIINQYWQGPNGYFSTAQNPVLTNVTSAMNGTYTVTGSNVSGVNLITNGDFENGYTGITSGYTVNTTTLVPEKTYAVIAVPFSEHADFCTCGDHTTGSGKQMVVNGSTSDGVSIWSQTITVIPNTNYQYSYWVQSVHQGSPAQIQLTINGVLIGPPNPATLQTGIWTEVIYNWNSGSTTLCNIGLRNLNLEATGNDFALDDIVFQEVSYATSTVNVNVKPLSVGGTITGGSTIYSGSSPTTSLTLTGNTGDVVKWQESSDLAFTLPVDIQDQTTTLTGATIGNLTATTYFRALVQSGPCSQQFSSPATITVLPGSLGGSVSGGATICEGSNSGILTLTGNIGSVVKWQYSVNPFSDWTDIVNTATTYTSGALTHTTMFRAVVQSGTSPAVNSDPTTVTVIPTPTATISYPASPFCNSLNIAQPVTLSGTGDYTGGTFSSTGGLTIDPVSGAITPNTSNAGTYTVTYTITTPCGIVATPATTTVIITPLAVATFIYRGNPIPSFINGGVAGTFSSTPGLNFVSTSTGVVDPLTSSAGKYTVTNTIAATGGCDIVTATSQITITSYHTVAFIWTGTVSTDWNDPQNWLPGLVPDVTSDVVIPDAATTPFDPVLPTGPQAIVRTINLETSAILNGGSSTTFTVAGSTYAWQNRGTFNPGTSTVNFTNPSAGMGGSTSFYNVQIPSGAGLTPQTGNLMQISGDLILQGTGMLNANASPNTIEYNGIVQSVINPNGSVPGYSNLILSGSGIKTFPTTPMTITGDCSVAGTATSDMNGTTTIGGNLSIASGSIANISPAVNLTVTGNINNSNGTSGLVLQSDITGTASLMNNTNGVSATVQRYIPGAAEAWHFISSPVSNQSIDGSWLPSGTYANGNGYDLYLWNEPSSCWIYQLNTTSLINWNTVHPGSNFQVGRGYLYSLQSLNPTNTFVGTLNNGPVTIPMTFNSTDISQKGFNLIGNPYPSSIDWQAASGWSRSILTPSAGGYDMWIFNPATDNYGVYNSASGLGTNDVTRYVSSGQGFFVLASASGTLQMDNGVRVNDQTTQFKNAKIYQGTLNVVVKSESDKSSDEVMLLFGNKTNNTGARKLFSNVPTAPSLYLPSSADKFTVRYLTDTTDNPSVPVMFKAGKEGNYILETSFDNNAFETVTLEDRKMHLFQNLKIANTYNFQASLTDDPNRFAVLFGKTKIDAPQLLPARVYTNGIHLVVDLTQVNKETVVFVYDIMGRMVLQNKLQAKSQYNLEINPKKQILLVQLLNADGSFYSKVLW